MKNVVRRRLTVGALAASSALIAGLVVAPAFAAAEGLRVSPSAVVNNATQDLMLTSTDADQRYGASATFTLNEAPAATFTVDIDPGLPVQKDTSGTASVEFADLGDGLGVDGPADVGTYRGTITGAPAPIPLPGTGGGGTDTCTACITVNRSADLVVTSVAPTSLRPGTSANLSVLGRGFTRSAKIEFLNGTTPDAGITFGAPLDANGAVEDDGITTATELRRRITVATGTAAGPRNVRVTVPGQQSFVLANAFTVSGAALVVVDPPGGDNAPTTTATPIRVATAAGTVTDGDLTLEFLGTPGSSTRQALTIPTTLNQSGTRTVNLSDAAPGVYQPVVRRGDVVNSCDSSTATGCRFTVTQARPVDVASLDRTGDATGSTQPAGSTQQFDVRGSGFSKGAAVTVSGTGVTVTAVEFVSATLLRATIQTTAAAANGARNVTVTTTDPNTSNAGRTDTCTGCYTVGPAAAPTTSAPATGTSNIAPGRYVGLSSPVRMLDTRGPNNDQPRRTREVVVDLSSRITDAGATSAVLNVTVTTPTRRGFVVAYPTGTTKPGTSNVNFEGGQTQANEVTVRLPADRRVSLFIDSAQAHVIADLVGYFTTTANAGGQVVTQTPTRVFDSRNTSTPKRTGEVVVALPQVATGTVDVILNVTVTGSTTADPRRGRGFVVAYATGTQRPGTSNVNFDAGQQQANEVITRVGTGQNARNVSLFIDSTRVGLIVDLVGYVVPTAQSGSQLFTPLTNSVRALDTRNGTGTSGRERRTGEVVVALPSSVPSGATAVVLNVTATNGSNRGFVTVFPTGTRRPETSNVNFPVNLTQANEAFTGISANRQVTLFVGGSGSPSAHLVADVVGYLTPNGTASGASASPTPACTESPLSPITGTSCPTSAPATTAPATTAPATTAPATTAPASPTASPTAACDPVREALGLCP